MNKIPVTETTIAFFKQYPDRKNSWGNLHIALDDGNLSGGDVSFCADQCIDNDDLYGRVLCEILSAMSKSQRDKLYDKLWE